MSLAILNPYYNFTDIDGTPLHNGFVYFGQVNLDGQISPANVYWDMAGTQPAPQPLRTVHGVIYNGVRPAQIFSDGEVSVKVLNQNQLLVDFQPSTNSWSFQASTNVLRSDLAHTSDISKGAALVGQSIQIINTMAVLRSVAGNASRRLQLMGYAADGDGGQGLFYWASSSTATDDGGTIINPTGNAGAGRWLRQINGPYMPEWFGARPSPVDSSTALQAAIDAANLATGGASGRVECFPGRTYYCTALPTMKQGVDWDLRRARINATLPGGNTFGVRMATLSRIRGGSIYVTPGGSASAQFIFQAPISAGAPNNNGDTAASPDPWQSVWGWVIENVELHNGREFGPVIQLMGDVSGWRISGVTIPDSSTCSGVHADWGNVGITSSADIHGTKTAFLAGTAYTTHPHNGVIENINAGALSVPPSGDLGASIVRLSACYGIDVRRISAKSASLTGFRNVGGDLGFEFARTTEKPQACRGITVRGVNFTAPTADCGDGIYIDTLADNVDREQTISGYVPLAPPLAHGDIRVTADISGAGVASRYGARIIQARGVWLEGGSYNNWDIGVWVDEFTQDCGVIDTDTYGCRQHGKMVGFAALREPTERITIRGGASYGNGTAGTGYGCYIARCVHGLFEDQQLGTSDEASQDIGLIVADNGVNFGNRVRNNHVHGATVAAYVAPGSSPPYYFDQLASWDNNTASPGCPQPIISSQPQLPLRSTVFGSLPLVEYVSSNSGDPTTGHWKRGGRIWRNDPTSGQSALKSVTTSGTFGTLSGLTNVGTSNTNKTVTMSLSARTATTTAGSYTAVVSDVTNIRIGMKISVVGGVTDARIIDISGTTLMLDKRTTAVTNGAVTCAGVIEGEVISINTTPAITGAVVMRVTGNNVTLDTPASSTETGRTASYTAPVFKTHAAIA